MKKIVFAIAMVSLSLTSCINGDGEPTTQENTNTDSTTVVVDSVKFDSTRLPVDILKTNLKTIK